MALVAAVAIGVYANSLGGALLYDDLNAITDNALVTTGDVRGILTTPSWWGADRRTALWRPLTTSSFALDHALFGLAPLAYHAENVALHAVVSVLVLTVFAAAGVATPIAGAAALLFAAHPVHTEAVANVVGRAELIAAAGFLAAWRAWLAAGAARGGRRIAWRLAALVAYVLAMLGKENAITLPAVLLLAGLVRPSDAAPARSPRRRAAAWIALAACGIAFVALRTVVVGGVTPKPELLDNPLALLPTLPRLFTAIAVIGRYALRLVFPLWLSADYSFDQIPAVATPLDPGFLAGLTVMVATAAALWWARRRAPAIALGLGLLALTFAPVANLAFPIGTIMGERLLYLPSAGFCLALAAGLARCAGARDSGIDGDARGVVVAGTTRHRTRWPPRLFLPLAVIVTTYGARTITRNTIWREPLVFFQTMVADAPRSARSHAELASALAEAGRFAEADTEFARALAITPADPFLLYDWGHALASAGDWDAAAEKYRRAIAVKPDFGEAFENLGGVESARGDQAAALAALRRAKELTPESPYLLMTTAAVLARAGVTAEARATYERALAQRPADPEVRTSYGAFLASQDDAAAAVAVLEPIAPPAPARALVALAASYRRLGRTAAAEATIATAARLYPDDPTVRAMTNGARREAGARATLP